VFGRIPAAEAEAVIMAMESRCAIGVFRLARRRHQC
jgi:hypothetical protein